jgi:mono/diheme cytochrome c family protein
MRTLLCALALLFAEGAADELRGEQPSLDRGRVIAERECARCHAVGPTGQSPHGKAPPFRELPKRYPVEHLAEALVEGIVVGHGDMPEFLFEPDDVDAILAYMASLEK